MGQTSLLIFQWEGKLHLLDVESVSHRELLSVEPPAVIPPYEYSVSSDGRSVFFVQRVINADTWLLGLE
jgi:hypothetical protein